MMESNINQRLNFDEMSCDEEEDNSSDATNSSSGECICLYLKTRQLKKVTGGHAGCHFILTSFFSFFDNFVIMLLHVK